MTKRSVSTMFEITSMVDTKSPGVHQVKYTYTDSRGLIGHTFLTVIVGEG